MKILCLHGYGTNASVLENQLQTFLSVADQDIEPYYLEGEIEAPKAASLGAFTQGNFYCYHDKFDPASVKEAHELLTEVINEEGPFDGILGFSQGGSLAIAYMLQHEVDHPNEPMPFKFAVIFSSIISFTPDATYCEDIVQALSDSEIKALSNFPEGDLSVLSPRAQTLFSSMAEALNAGQEGGFLPSHPDTEAFSRGDSSRIPRIVHPDLVKQRIRIPTIHVVGKADSPLMLRQSELMYQVCDPSMSKWLEHSGGHDIPRQMQDVQAAVKAVEWAVTESAQQAWARV